MKVIGVTDSDSYVKWGATILDRMPDDWDTSITLIRTPALPSRDQISSALMGTRFSVGQVSVIDLPELSSLVATEEPDVVLLSVRGPVVRVLVRMIVAALARRPLIVSGLPGIAIPETLNALYYRSQVDCIILHSKREVRAFAALATQLGIEQDFALATLPFLPSRRPHGGAGSDIVFAAQAKVPRSIEHRVQLLNWLAEAATRNPERRVVLKLRGLGREAQTHSERYPYDDLLSRIKHPPANLVVSTGPMGEHLRSAGGLVTVSSTAALEAIASGVPVLAIDEFGVDKSMINLVFEGSGLLAGSTELLAGDFREPHEGWLDENYFHAPSDETWIEHIELAARQRELGPLPLRPQFRGTLGGNLRRIWDRKIALGPYDRSLDGYLALAVGLPLRGAVRQARKIQSALRQPSAADRELTSVP